jgi:hypothetical protein
MIRDRTRVRDVDLAPMGPGLRVIGRFTGLGPGFNGPLVVVVEGNPAAAEPAARALDGVLATEVPGFAGRVSQLGAVPYRALELRSIRPLAAQWLRRLPSSRGLRGGRRV